MEPRVFKTDGELYDESLTRNTKSEASDLLKKIVDRINLLGFVTVMHVAMDISKFPKPKNWQYAASHGWTRSNVEHFTVRELNDSRWGVFLGTPHVLLNDNV